MRQVISEMSIRATLDSTFIGELIRPGDPGYDDARQLFNGGIDKRPALIARCTGPQDVQAALAHAREQGLPVAVRGGGHSAVGYSSCDDGIVIDTGPMKSVEIDVDARTGRFGAGLTWGELDAATQEHGLAVTGGRVTHTGIAGLTLGSGSGWIDRKLGSTCESLISAEVVTADGRVVRASADENADRLCRDDPAPARRRQEADALLSRLHGSGARRGWGWPRPPYGAAGGLRARG